MRRPTNTELTNLIRNLEELGRVTPGDKLGVTSDRFSVQRKGFFSQSVARTFSRNSARAYFLPIYRLFQIAVVDRLWNGLPQPWPQIDAAFSGVERLRQTYVLELEEAQRKRKSEATVAEKSAKVTQLDRLLAAVTPLVRSPRNVSPDNIWAAAPRGYGRSRVIRFSNALKQRIIDHRRYGATSPMIEATLHYDPDKALSAGHESAATGKRTAWQNDRGNERTARICSLFKSDAIDRSMTLLVHNALPFDHHGVGFEATLNYYLGVLHGDVAMLEEIAIWCNQGGLGSVGLTVVSEGPVPHARYYNFLTAFGMPLCPNPGSPHVKFNLFEVRPRKTVGVDGKLHDEVAEASIHVSITTDRVNFFSAVSQYAEGPSMHESEGEFGRNSVGPLAEVDIQFDFVILRTGPTSFQYRVMNEQMIYETRPDEPGQETPQWMLQLDP